VLAQDLAEFIKGLQRIDASEGPSAGAHNFYRGGDLAVYDQQTQNALDTLSPEIDVESCRQIWNAALSTQWTKKPVWVHGDIAPGNLIVRDRKLAGVIDFGVLGTGDPACDLVIAWTFLDGKSRNLFMDSTDFDQATWRRAQGWALWKALITWANSRNEKQREHAKMVVGELLKDRDEAVDEV